MGPTFTPNEERFGFNTRGMFRCKLSKFTEILLVSVITIAVLSGFSACLAVYRNSSYISAESAAAFAGMLTSFTLLVFIVIWIFLVNLVFIGVEYSYVADSKKCTITSKARGVFPAVINYADVRYTIFKPISFFGFSRGFEATIVTSEREYKYEITHGFKRNHIPDIKDCPLYFIEERVFALKNKKEEKQENESVCEHDSSFLF